MCVQRCRLYEALETGVALVAAFSGVRPFVHDQRRLLGEALRTEAALERTLARVHALVRYHRVSECEPLAAESTLPTLLARTCRRAARRLQQIEIACRITNASRDNES